MKYTRNSSEIMLLPGQQLRLRVYQKMCSSRSSALQGVWLGLKIVLVFKHHVQLKMELVLLKAPKGGGGIAKISGLDISNRTETPECISHTSKFNFQS